VQVAQHVLQRLETVDNVSGAGNDLRHRLEQVPQSLRGDARLVSFSHITFAAHVTEVALELACLRAHARRERFAEHRNRCRAAVLPQPYALAIRLERPREPALEPREAPVDVLFQRAIRVRLFVLHLRDEPIQSGPLPPAERATLVSKPGQVHLEIATISGIVGQVAKAATELLTEIVAQVRSKRTLPAAEPPEGDAEVVKRLIVGLARKAGMGRVRVGQVAERYQSDRSISRFAKVVDSRGHSWE
jgi:hypothetical protein